MPSSSGQASKIKLLLVCIWLLQPVFVAPANAADADFAGAVIKTGPIAYYRLNTIEGKSTVGTSQYKSQGGVSLAGPGAPVGAGSQFVNFGGGDGYILTTQSGGVNGAASMMAWVRLAALPSDIKHFFYVMGESQNGNDLDVQFETDNQLKFYTAAGGHVSFTPPLDSLLNQWHLIVTTLDTPTRTRVIYWDGKAVATDKGSGQPNKSGLFSIGASTIFSGRYFKGGIQEVALWDRALKAGEVTAIYAAASPATPGAPVAAATSAAAAPSAPEEDNPFNKRNKPAAGALPITQKSRPRTAAGRSSSGRREDGAHVPDRHPEHRERLPDAHEARLHFGRHAGGTGRGRWRAPGSPEIRSRD